MTQLTRRDLLRGTVLTGAGIVLPRTGWATPRNQVTFTDVAHSAGINFIHDNAASPEKFLMETMGSGCAWIDYDQTGLLIFIS